MQIAILVVLIIIAVILAPWLISVALALIAIYGVWVVVAAVGGVIGLLVLAVLFSGVEVVTQRLRSKRTSKTEQMISEANQKFRADAAEEARIADERRATLRQSADEHRQRNYRSCPHCNEQMPRFGLFCPNCGKDPKSASSNK